MDVRDDESAGGSAGRAGGGAGQAAVIGSPAEIGKALEAEGYLADEQMEVACFLAVTMRRPLFLEGAAGVGKTAVADALARILKAPLIRLQCYEGIDAAQALYDWDFPRQLLHLRAAEASGTERDAGTLERELYSRDFLVARPLLRALETNPSVLLIDEVDRADDEFEALLLEMLSEFSVTIPEIGTVRATTPPVVIVTSNRTREVHDALKRRCLYHWVDNPSFEREVAVIERRLPHVTRRIAERVAGATQRLRQKDLLKPPGVAEALDWAESLTVLGADDLTPAMASATLGSVLKYHEDIERVHQLGLAELVDGDGRD